jgi:hypothetical protein
MGKMASGLRVKKILAVVFLLGVTGIARLSAFWIDFIPPTVGGSNPARSEFQRELNRIFAEENARYNELVDGIDPNPQKLIGAFATSSVFSSTGASLRTFQGYNAFALTLGAMTGIQLPVSVNYLFRDLEYIGDQLFSNLNANSDLRMGMNPQMINAQLGINTSGFLLKGLYVGIKGGYMSLPSFNLGGLQMSFQTWSIGGMVNYQLFPQIRIPTGIIVWQGINLGTGIIYQNTSLAMDVPLIPEGGLSSDLVSIGNTGASLDLGDPKITFRFGVDTFTVPLEVVTAIRLLGFANFSFGAGADFGFGSASMSGNVRSEINLRNLPGDLRQTQPGRMVVSIGGSNSPALVSPKIMASFAINVGPAIILDIPFTYYFLNEGYGIGVTFGIVF